MSLLQNFLALTNISGEFFVSIAPKQINPMDWHVLLQSTPGSATIGPENEKRVKLVCSASSK